MYPALTAEQSRELERHWLRQTGGTLDALMDSAGRRVAEQVMARVPHGPVVVLSGPGNNGGDGWVAAEVLGKAGREVRVVSTVEPSQLKGEAARAAARAIGHGIPWEVGDPVGLSAILEGAFVVVDALLGTGSRLPLRDPIAAWCDAVRRSGARVIAVDVPTGVDSDTGEAAPEASGAEVTVTFSAPKLGLVTHPGAAFAGEIVVADIGIPSEMAPQEAPEIWEHDDFADLLPIPPSNAHKNSRGRVLVIAGSGRFPGAAVLAARGAMRMGAGYVTLAVPEPVVPLAQAHLLAAPVIGLPSSRTRTFSSAAAAAALDMAADYDAVVLGPGLTLADGAVATARSLFARLAKPLVVDADALNALVDAREMIEQRGAPTVLTPHPGELGRLLGSSAASVQGDRVSSSRRLAGPQRVIVLKGAGTVVSSRSRSVIITAGTPALATAGTGDVLSGVIGSLLAQGLRPLEAAALGAHLHARAGEEAAATLTPLCVTAEDVPDHLPWAVGDLLGSW